MYPARCGFYSKFFIYKQTGLSQLFIVLLALILTFMSLLLTYHSRVYTSVPACALELGPVSPDPAHAAAGHISCGEVGAGPRPRSCSLELLALAGREGDELEEGRRRKGIPLPWPLAAPCVLGRASSMASPPHPVQGTQPSWLC